MLLCRYELCDGGHPRTLFVDIAIVFHPANHQFCVFVAAAVGHCALSETSVTETECRDGEAGGGEESYEFGQFGVVDVGTDVGAMVVRCVVDVAGGLLCGWADTALCSAQIHRRLIFSLEY